ncbi:MAG TPA: bifunctional diaminohydroxyphosphoribosylaminopyrimidine deaminase/5-amino-6-(5-phosphoribosylamino)uracil reductase RibD [Thermoanaerobaculia bacterium]|nr:bifunctional diaminohydroxyphosphoribosylaminopyrimidine deaminase/5-amino-6-(5-phosphoribosylamino)uracil reductase RibD [Thermoanaerobaculia bacterium]
MSDETFMRRAVELAEKGRYTVSPNPMVGCVIVREGRIIGEGFHRRAGEAHAEIEALRSCSEPAADTDVYVTLEPCAHFGRTPPCADALVSAGVKRVLVATGDPHPDVDGRGIAKLRERGIAVETGLLRELAERQNEKFLHAARTGLPFLLLKAGMSLDGKLATAARESRWITSSESRERSLALREEFDAVLVGSGTVREDDPQLTRRLGWSADATAWTRVIVDATGLVPGNARVLTDGGRTLLFTSRPKGIPSRPGLEVVPTDSAGGLLDLRAVLAGCHARGIRSIIAEGGSLLHSEIIRARLWQKMILFVAPMFVGGAEAPSIFTGRGAGELTDAWRFRFDRVERVGSDLMLVAYP